MQRSDSDDKVIEIDDYRYVGSEERPELDLSDESTQQSPALPYVWVRQSSNGGCCCFSLSGMALFILFVFALGLLALCWLIAQVLGWAWPF